jgi:predicted nucleic acid-binding protein
MICISWKGIMQVFDASSIIHAWDNYPVDQFPSMWNWMAAQLNAGGIMMPSVAMGEVGHMAPECADWLRANGLQQIAMDDQILQEALRIKNLLGIVGDRYGGGVDENDLFIVATSRFHGDHLISNENVQTTLPAAMHNYKIPAVCRLATVNVDCINFVEFIKQSKAVFG